MDVFTEFGGMTKEFRWQVCLLKKFEKPLESETSVSPAEAECRVALFLTIQGFLGINFSEWLYA